MKKETKRKVKKAVGVTSAVVSTAFVGMMALAKLKKGQSVYDDDLKEKNPLEGKKVHFVESEEDKENADGVKGHLEAVGESNHQAGFYERYVKRGMDIVLSFGGLVALSPIMGVIALAIKVEDPGPVLFTQKRMGQNKKYFKLHKFRSMKMNTPHDVPTHMLDNPDQYITKVGRFLRAHSLDELPQIWDIFIGNMSVIGPRPGLWNQDILTAERDKYGANDVKPGLTGWAQINGRDEIEIPDKAKLDGDYVQNMGPKMDAKVFLKSLHVFGKDESVVEGGTGEMKKIKQYNYENDLISIITPAYNASAYIEKTIESVKNQTYENWELIIVDDNSNDDTLDLITKYAGNDERILIVHNEINKGVAASRNIALKCSKGEYIAFLDSDDIWKKDKLDKQLSYMKANNYALTYTAYQKYNTSNNKIGKVIKIPSKMTYNKIFYNTAIACLTVIVNRGMVGDFSMPLIEHTEDQCTWQAILKRGYTAYGLDESLAFYRVGSNSLTSNKKKAIQGQWKTYREYYKFSFIRSFVYFSLYSINAVVKHGRS